MSFGIPQIATWSAAAPQMLSSTASTVLALTSGLAFAIVILGVATAAVLGRRRILLRRKLQAENPASPWKWREDWEQGRCNSRTKGTMIQAWAFALLWNLVSAPVLVFIPAQLHRQPASVIAFLFPIVGAGLLVWAIRETWAWLEFGVTFFEMNATPAVIGREFQGNIHARFPYGADHGIRLKLSCINRIVTGSGKSESTNENILWRAEKNLAAAELFPGPEGTLIPVRFSIPWNAMQTNATNPRNSILWLLEADADVPGVDYKDIFELPVFRTKDTPESPEPDAQQDHAILTAPSRPTVLVTSTSQGTEFYFPPARNPGFALGLTTFSFLWSGVLMLLFYLHAPIIFPVVFGFFDLLLLTGAVQLWLGTSRVIVDSSRVRVQMGLLGGGKWREYAKAQILDIQAIITAQQGGASGTPYYDIRLLQTEHQNVTLGRTIRDKEEAEWLVSEMKKALQVRSAVATAGN